MVSNHCPISLLCIISKVLERIVYNNVMMEHFLYLSLVPCLHGQSSLQQIQLLTFINEILNANQTNNAWYQCSYSTYLDIRKAFDTVAHHILLMKLHKCGISGGLLKWFYASLSSDTSDVVGI